MSKFRLENLDSIRSIAFLSTFLAHAFYAATTEIQNNTIYINAIRFREVFSFGVPIFFVLSGFLITFLMLKEQEETKIFSIKNFYIRRILRIWPVYYVVIFFGFIIFPILRTYFLHTPNIENAHPLMYLFYLSNFDQIFNNVLPFGVGLGPTWSVSVEEQFYLLWPILIFLFPRRKFLIPIGILMLISVISSHFFHLKNQHTLHCFIYLTTGGFYAYLSYYHKKFLSKIISIHSIFFFIFLSLLFLVIYYLPYARIAILNIWIIAILIGYLIIYQSFSGKIPLKKIPFIENLGKYTYGLYLYHSICIFIIHTIIYDILKLSETISNVVIVVPLFSLFLSITVSIVSYNFMEKYFLNLKEKFSAIK